MMFLIFMLITVNVYAASYNDAKFLCKAMTQAYEVGYYDNLNKKDYGETIDKVFKQVKKLSPVFRKMFLNSYKVGYTEYRMFNKIYSLKVLSNRFYQSCLSDLYK